MDGFVLIAVCVLTGLCIYSYFAKENTDFNTTLDLAQSLQGSNKNIESQQKVLRADQEMLADQSAKMITDLNKRVQKLEEKPAITSPIKVSLSEPIRINLIYKKSGPKVEAKVPGPMLKRAGIKPLLDQ